MENSTIAPALSQEEVKWIIQAFLRHPERKEHGGTEAEILHIIRWAEEIKIKLLFDMNLLYNLYMGNIVVDVDAEGEVRMSITPEDALSVQRDEGAIVRTITSDALAFETLAEAS